MGRGDAHNPARCVSPVKIGIRSAIDFGAFNGGRRERAEIESSTQVPGTCAVNENHVRIRSAAADEQRSLGSHLACLDDKRAGHQPQCAHQVQAKIQVERAENAGRSARLRLRNRCSCCRNHD